MITTTKTPTQYKSGSNYYHEMTITTPALTGWSGSTTKLAFYSIWCEDLDYYSNGLVCASLLEENIIDSSLHGRIVGYKTNSDSYVVTGQIIKYKFSIDITNDIGTIRFYDGVTSSSQWTLQEKTYYIVVAIKI